MTSKLFTTQRGRLIVNRTHVQQSCARCRCAYEWGGHVAFFSSRVELTHVQVRATVLGAADDPVWADEERLLIQLVDELHDSANISDELWTALHGVFSVD
jgi:hypothetical protein